MNFVSPHDIMQRYAQNDMQICYNLEKGEILRMLEGHPEGTYIIHQSREKNEITQPYTIYAAKTSSYDGRIRLVPAYIYFDETTNQFSVGTLGKKYHTLQELVQGNKKLLKWQIS